MNFIVLNILFIIQYQIFYILDKHIQVFNFLLLLKQMNFFFPIPITKIQIHSLYISKILHFGKSSN